MSELDSQTAYWDTVAPTKRFTHPLHLPWLDGLSRDAAVLDYGCGYGRAMEALAREGFTDLSGVDTSGGMVAQARALHPAMRFAVLDTPPRVALPDESVDLVLLFTVLTCVPGDEAQRRLVGELHRVLRPGGALYVSDLPLQEDPRNRERYARCAERYGTYGVFETDDGAVCRHHDSAWFPSLLADFRTADTRRFTVHTMNGHECEAVQILARKPAAPDRTPGR